MVVIAIVQLFLVFREPIFSPVDELQHVDYVRTIAEEGHPPIFGVTQVDPRLLALYVHVQGRTLTPAETARLPSSTRLSYEALQFPAFYLLAAPLYRLLDQHLVVAVYAIRSLNAGLAILLAFFTLRLLELTLPSRRLAALVALAVLLIPQVSSRASQVNNQTLCALLVSLVLYRLAKPEAEALPVSRPAASRRRAFTDGVLGGLATMTKITAVALVAPALLAWRWRVGGLRQHLVPGVVGAAIPAALWLAWSFPVYGGPFPWSGSHLVLFPSPPVRTLEAWLRLGSYLINGLWLPYEWDPGHHWVRLTIAAEVAATLVFLCAFVAGVVSALSGRVSVASRTIAMGVAAIAAFVVGYALFEFTRRRFIYGTDPRELWTFVAPMALLLGALVRRLGNWAGGILCAAAVAGWLAIDLGLYLFGSCPRCP